MWTEYLLNEPKYWLIPWVMQSIAYFFVLRKMGLRVWTALVPFIAEHELSTVLFRKIRTFWRPFSIAAVMTAAAYYLGTDQGTGQMFMIVAQVVYWLFLVRLFFRLSKSFGHGIPYTILLTLVPTLFLLILGLGKSQYHPLQFKQERSFGRFLNGMRKLTFTLVSVVELIALVAGVGFVTIQTYPPRPLANMILNDVYKDSKDIEADGNCVTREETMGDAAASLADMPVSRDKFFPDHSGDKSVVVMEYVIGADLEDRIGCASANIRMMQDATKKGDALTFVLEAGGSRRWFTPGITEKGYGRYTVKGGNVEKAMDLDLETMESPSELTEFIKWTAKNYPADRYMLALWDHGGGVPYGYGVDQLAHRTDADDRQGLSVSEVAEAAKESGVKFDVIGFDACLMQDIEIAKALEPCADYFLASEETEGGFGWYYTSAFGKLAQDPGMSSEEFGKDMVSAYDQFNRAINDGNVQSASTLSFVDLTRVAPAYKKVSRIFKKADAAIKEDPQDFAELGLAAMNSYSFVEDLQIDLIDFINKLNDTDLNNSICSEAERKEAVDAIKASVIFRNRDSAEGINGMALALPYKTIGLYTDTNAELKNLGLKRQIRLFDDIFSIIAVQKKAEHEKKMEEVKDNRFGTFIEEFSFRDHTTDEWYKEGFENYEPTADLVDIPVKDTGNGWQVQLPEKTWGIIADCRTAVYQKTEDGSLRFLGYDHVGDNDADGHPMVDMDDMWIHINGRLVYYDAKTPRETEEGTVFSGDTKALLNGEDEIIVHIEWDPVKGDEDAVTGHVTGYDFVEDEFAFMSKGMQSFNTGDSIEFLFDYYDEEGNLISTEPYGDNIRVTKPENLKAEDKPLPEGDVQFLGVLTDVYQRELMTEVLEGHIGK
ncbi:MAG: hypothetical protein E7220_01030 [Clostridiales bacterium]|nr:hypothetical protein [Clostridiales bacterium]